jgi:hypothetical protein
MAAASLWVQYIQPLRAHGVRLGSPAVSNAPSGIPWLSQFFGNCTECTFDFIPIHWYGEGLDNFKDYVESFYGKFSSPMWVTEFASTSSNVNGEYPSSPIHQHFLLSMALTSYVYRGGKLLH